MNPIRLVILALGALVTSASVSAQTVPDLSPARWSAEERAELERLEGRTRPEEQRVVQGTEGFVAGTMSPTSLRVGLDVLRQGGTAADAATAIALTQVSRALGSFVSYAGIAQILYLDAKTGRVTSIDAGWATYREETELASIPTVDSPKEGHGRKTLVPGFLAGMEALHQRFGTLPFATLVEPAIWFAEHGVPISRAHKFWFEQRHPYLGRTESGRRFMAHAGKPRPDPDDLFLQPELALTLRGIAREGAAYMYTGAWAQHYVATIRAEGGRVTADDLARYRPVVQESLHTTFSGCTVHAPGRSAEGGYEALSTLNLIEELGLEQTAPYWKDVNSFRRLSQVMNVTDVPAPWLIDLTRARGVRGTREQRAEKAFARELAPLVPTFFQPRTAPTASSHTAGIVVVDRSGNIAAVVHSINTVLWGTTGIVVDGVPISDAAVYNSFQFPSLKPGDRLYDTLVPVIATRDGQPTLAVAVTGSVQRETVRIVLGLLGQRCDAAELMNAPPLITSPERRVEFYLPGPGYDDRFLQEMKDGGARFEILAGPPDGQPHPMRGVGVYGFRERPGAPWQMVEVPGLFSFGAAY